MEKWNLQSPVFCCDNCVSFDRGASHVKKKEDKFTDIYDDIIHLDFNIFLITVFKSI